MKTYQLTITENQAKAIKVACEFLSRVQGGQVREVFQHLPLRKDINWSVYHEIQDELTKRMPEILKDGIDGYKSSFGVGNPDLNPYHDIAWDLYQVLRHQLSWDDAIEEGLVKDLNSPRDWSSMMGCCYDEPMKFGSEPLAKMERVPFYPDCYNQWSLCKYTYDGDHKCFDILFEGTEEECRQYAYENYTDKEQGEMCLMDYEGREWDV